MAFVQTASVDNNVVALPRVDTKHILPTSDYFSSDALIEREMLKQGDIAEYYNHRDLLTILELSNRVGTTNALQSRSWEAGPMFRPVKIGAVVGTANATEAIVTLSADSYRVHPELGGDVARSSLLKNAAIRFTNGLTAHVQQKGVGGTNGVATQFKLVKGTASAGSLATAIAAQGSTPLFVFTTTYAEGSKSPDEGLERGTTQWRNYSHTIKTFANSTAHVNVLPIIDITGATKYYDKQGIEMALRQRIDEKLALWFGTGDEYIDEFGKPARQCIGVDTAIQSMGNVYNYTRTAKFAKADLVAVLSQIKAVNGGGTYIWHMGYELMGAVQDILTELVGATGQTGIDYSSFGDASSQKKMIDLGFMSFRYMGITIHMVETDVLSVPELTGIAGYNYPANGYLLQDTKQSIELKENGRSTQLLVPSLRVDYTKEHDGVLRRYSKYKRGRAITGNDENIQEMLTHFLPSITNSRKMFLINAV